MGSGEGDHLILSVILDERPERLRRFSERLADRVDAWFEGRLRQRERALTLGQTIGDFTAAQVTSWDFDLNDRMVGHTDDGPNTTGWSYDALDRPTDMTYPDASSASYEYDANSNVTKLTDAAGNVIEDAFDALDRNTSRSVTLVSGFGGTTSETRTYDALGRTVTSTDNDYQLSYEYEVNGLRSLVYTETQAYVGVTTWPKTVTRTHDPLGNVITELYPDTLALERTWNPINRLQGVTDGSSTIASFTYWGGRPKGVVFGNASTQTNTYTGFRSEVARIHHQNSSQGTILQLDYGYDANHDRLYERYGGAGSSGDAFAYDRLHRLTNAWMGSATPSNPVGASYTKRIDYNYDDDGNRTSVVTTPWGGAPGSTAYTANSLNQYTAVGGTTQQHDGNGNLSSDGQFTYEYDYRNQLIEVSNAAGLVASYKYDPAGRRVEKYVTATGLNQRYVYSGLETIAVYDGSDNWKQDFVFGDVIDQVLMLQQADLLDYDGDQDTSEIARHYYHRNALGSVMELSDPSQTSAVSYRYDPYGKPMITVGGQVQATDPLGQHWAFTGRFLDEETGLCYYRARHYSPAIGRFLQRDPKGLGPGPNLYAYASLRPTVLRDPLGLEEESGSGSSEPEDGGLLQALAKAAEQVIDLVPFIPHSANPFLDPAGNIAQGLYLGAIQDFVEEVGRRLPTPKCNLCCKISLRFTAHEDLKIYINYRTWDGQIAGTPVVDLPDGSHWDWHSGCVFPCDKPVRIYIYNYSTEKPGGGYVTAVPTTRCGFCRR